MVDPDARYPENPTSRFILHWLQTDVTPGPVGADGNSQLINTTVPRVAYRGPGPPTNSSAHRYILYAFYQHENFTFPSTFESFNSTNRANFNLTAFLDESNLGQVPAAAQYYYASNQTGIPQDFSAAAGGTYPGGNGEMITQGPGPSVTISSNPATASATTTGSGAATSGSGTATESGGQASGSGTATESGGTASGSGSATESAAASGTNDAAYLGIGPGAAFAAIFGVLNIL